MSKALHLRLCLVVKLEDFLHEASVSIAQLLIVPDVVQDGSCLRFDFVDVEVEGTGDLVGLLLLGSSLLSLFLLRFTSILLGESQLGLNAVLEVAALFLPKLF